ncbi:hypothetical protein [Nocardia acidivorans]|uniref:hypothetical protein n=1 Tax=Nocardia acidivorans TaxID=404580 RepID=UPI000AE0B1F6|nr:hypothetical protein [Nocardia acidivorans]
MTARTLRTGHGPRMAGGHGICAIGVPAGWVVHECTVQPRNAPMSVVSTGRPLTLIRKGI